MKHNKRPNDNPATKENLSKDDVIKFLWNIIDDIDTYSDLAKANDRMYRNLVTSAQKKRWELPIIISDNEIDLSKLPVMIKNREAMEVDVAIVPSIDDAGVMAVSIAESQDPPLKAQEEAYFIAGFTECIKYIEIRYSKQPIKVKSFFKNIAKEFFIVIILSLLSLAILYLFTQ